MKKYTLLFIPLLFVLACKKDTVVTKKPDPTLSKPLSKPIDYSHLFKNIIKINYNRTTEFKLGISKDSFLGSLTTYGEKDNFINPLNGATLINAEISMMTVDGALIQKQALGIPKMSTFRVACRELSAVDQVLSPTISYALYSPDSLTTKTTTNITLVLKSTYFSLNLNPVEDENIKLSNNFQMSQAKSAGVYLAKMGYGMTYITEIKSDLEPRILVPALEAYLNDFIYHKGLNTAELKKEITLKGTSVFDFFGGPVLDWYKVTGGDEIERVDYILKKLFIPKAQNAFEPIDYEFRSLKDHKIVK